MELLSDQALIECVLESGDQVAYATLIGRHYPAAYRQACALVGDPIEAQDLVQEAFLTAHIQLHSLKEPARFAGWLRRIVYSTCMDWHRQRRVQFYHFIDPSNHTCPLREDLFDGETETPLEWLLRDELMGQIREAAEALPSRYRLALTLYLLGDCTHEEVAEELDVPLGTALSLVFRARSKMRQALNGYVQQTAGWSRIELGFHSLPSRQGWRYRSWYQFLPGGVAEERVFSVCNGVLILDNADLFPDNAAIYSLDGVVHPYRPFMLELRTRKLRETARYPEYQVPPFAYLPHHRNSGFSVDIYRHSG